jgi:hypothetical protein
MIERSQQRLVVDRRHISGFNRRMIGRPIVKLPQPLQYLVDDWGVISGPGDQPRQILLDETDPVMVMGDVTLGDVILFGCPVEDVLVEFRWQNILEGHGLLQRRSGDRERQRDLIEKRPSLGNPGTVQQETADIVPHPTEPRRIRADNETGVEPRRSDFTGTGQHLYLRQLQVER